MQEITPLSTANTENIQAIIDNKTKPLGALGQLENIALQLALICQQRRTLSAATHTTTHTTINTAANTPSAIGLNHISLNKPSMIVFAGDHGINEADVSIAPSAVTKQMVLNFLHGGAAINCFCQTNDISLTVVDCGILEAVTTEERPNVTQNVVNLLEQRLGKGTENFAKKAAMITAQLEQGFNMGRQLIETQVEEGVELLLLGEMGIANTSAAAALMTALTDFSVKECVGRGTGITDEQFDTKNSLIEQAIQRLKETGDIKHAPTALEQDKVLKILAELGGFEIVQMVAAIVTAASKSIPIVIDGFIVSVAALVALRLNKNVANYLIFAHVSQEQAHQLLLNELLSAQDFSKQKAEPLLDLGLRLGEGTGAALALPIIKASANFYNNMASFESAGVTV